MNIGAQTGTYVLGNGKVFLIRLLKEKKRLHRKNSNKILWLGKSTKVTVSSKLCTSH